MADSLASAIHLETIGDNNKPPKMRLSDPSKAREIVTLLIEADKERNRIDTKIKGMLDGNPPYARSKLKAQGQNWRFNVNWLEGKGLTSGALSPYYDLFSGAPQYMEVFTDFGGSEDDKTAWSRIITEEVTLVLKKWKGFNFNINAMLHDFITYGKGFVFFSDDRDFRFKHVSKFRVKVPDGTNADTEDLQILVVQERMSVDELWGYIKNEKSSVDAGWDREAVLDAIKNATPEIASNVKNTDYYYYQQKLQDHDLYEGIRCETVQAAHIYVLEFDGTVTHLIIVERTDFQTQSPADRATDMRESFLFKKKARYENFNQLFAPFFLEVLDGSWHGASGLGKDIYAPMEAKNRLRNTELDLAFIRSSVFLRATSANAMETAQLTQLGVISVIPVDFEVQQSTILGDVDGIIKVNRDIDEMIQNNTGVYKTQMQRPEGNPRTAKEVSLQYMQQAMLGNSSVNRFYDQLDDLYCEVYRRLSEVELPSDPKARELVSEFRKRCKDRGVPPEALKYTKIVNAYRNIGNGSPFMRQQNIAGIAPIMGRMPETGQQRFVEDWAASFSNQSYIERWFPKNEVQNLPTDEQAYAMLENAAMKEGAPVAWTPSQNNMIHAQTHIQFGAQALQSVSQGGNPAEVLACLDDLGTHTARHMYLLSQDPTRKDQYKALDLQFKQLAGATDKLRKNIAQMQQQKQQQAAQQSQVMSEQQLAQWEMMSDDQRKNYKLKAEDQRKNIKLQSQLQRDDAKTATDIQLKKFESMATVGADSD